MSDLNLSTDETRPEHQTHDLERSSDETVKHEAHQVSSDVNIRQPYHATAMYKAMYQSLMLTPWGIGMILQSMLPTPTSSSRRGVSAIKAAGVLTGIIVGAVAEAPVAAGVACLENLIGSWLMRLHHSHEDHALHSGSAQGNYAIAGAILSFPATAVLVVGWACLSNTSNMKLAGVAYLATRFGIAAAAGAVAAAIGAARGFEIQTVAHSAVANVAGMGFLVMVLSPFFLNLWLFGMFVGFI